MRSIDRLEMAAAELFIASEKFRYASNQFFSVIEQSEFPDIKVGDIEVIGDVRSEAHQKLIELIKRFKEDVLREALISGEQPIILQVQEKVPGFVSNLIEYICQR